MTASQALRLAALAGAIGSAPLDAAASCRGAAGVHADGRMVEAPAITGIVTGSVALPAFRCRNGVWVCAKRCGAETGAAYIFRDGRLLRLRDGSR